MSTENNDSGQPKDFEDVVDHEPESKHGMEGEEALHDHSAGPNSDQAGKPQAPQTGNPRAPDRRPN